MGRIIIPGEPERPHGPNVIVKNADDSLEVKEAYDPATAPRPKREFRVGSAEWLVMAAKCTRFVRLGLSDEKVVGMLEHLGCDNDNAQAIFRWVKQRVKR